MKLSTERYKMYFGKTKKPINLQSDFLLSKFLLFFLIKLPHFLPDKRWDA